MDMWLHLCQRGDGMRFVHYSVVRFSCFHINFNCIIFHFRFLIFHVRNWIIFPFVNWKWTFFFPSHRNFCSAFHLHLISAVWKYTFVVFYHCLDKFFFITAVQLSKRSEGLDEANSYGPHGYRPDEGASEWPGDVGGPSVQSGQVLRQHAGVTADVARIHG